MNRLTSAQVPLARAKLVARQGGKCPLCLTDITLATSCLDHDHVTGAVRDALCRNCNGIEGKIKNLVTRARRGAPYKDYLLRIIGYWDKHAENRYGLWHPTHKTDDEKRIRRNTLARKKRAAKKG